MLKLQYFGHLILSVHSLEKTLMLGRIEGKKIREPQKMRWLDGITVFMHMSLRELWQIVKDREALVCCSPGSQRVGHNWATEKQQQNTYHNKTRGGGDITQSL